MKVLHVTFRYGRDVYGGAEAFVKKLSEGLARKDVEVDVCTTKSHALVPFVRSAVRWDNSLDDESINGVRVLRFPVRNHDRYSSFLCDRLIQKRLDREEGDRRDEIGKVSRQLFDGTGCLLLDGWNEVERHGAAAIRWTRGRASFLLNDAGVSGVTLSLANPKRIRGKIVLAAGGVTRETALPTAGKFTSVTVSLPATSGPITGTIALDRTWHPLKDIRELGVCVGGISYDARAGGGRAGLERDYRKLLVEKRLYVDHLVRAASARPRSYCRMFDYLRGPDSPAMARWLKRHAPGYDLVMASMFPFNTIGYALAARAAGTPFVALPLMHPDDGFYHWPHYYGYLRQADQVFALSGYAKSRLFDPLGVKSTVIGAGVDSSLYLDRAAAGRAFRDRHGLGEGPIVLTVARKGPGKRYGQIIEAVEKVNERGGDVRLVMAGPDEDGVPVGSRSVSCLGKLADEELVAAYDACDLFAMMSESESFGMVFCEAWARGKAVIGNSYCGPVASLVDDGVDGLLCRNPQDLADGIERLLRDGALRERMGKNGHDKVVSNYTWDKVADRVYACYGELIGDSRT